MLWSKNSMVSFSLIFRGVFFSSLPKDPASPPRAPPSLSLSSQRQKYILVFLFFLIFLNFLSITPRCVDLLLISLLRLTEPHRQILQLLICPTVEENWPNEWHGRIMRGSQCMWASHAAVPRGVYCHRSRHYQGQRLRIS